MAARRPAGTSGGGVIFCQCAALVRQCELVGKMIESRSRVVSAIADQQAPVRIDRLHTASVEDECRSSHIAVDDDAHGMALEEVGNLAFEILEMVFGTCKLVPRAF